MSCTSLKVKEVKIKKPRKCTFCRDQHEAGQKMVYHAGVFDGDFQSYHCCLCCEDFINKNTDFVVQDNEIYEDFVYETEYKEFKYHFKQQTQPL